MKKQQGSAHVIIVVVLVVALLGALGFIFWQNFIAKDSESKSNEKQTTKQEDKKKEVVSEETEDAQAMPDGYIAYNDESTGFSLAYPKEWGDLKITQTQSSTNRMGANGTNIKALAGSNGVVRIAVYTLDSFFTKNAAGYVVRNHGGMMYGAYAGSETYEGVDPISGTKVYAHNHGDAGFVAYDLFFKAGNSVVYINVGDSKDTQTQIAKTVKVD